MMGRNAELATVLSYALKLVKPPIAISFRPESSRKLERNVGTVPSSCAFWSLALDRSFYTLREDHQNCSIGAVTHGFKKPEDAMPECGCADVAMMIETGWISRSDVECLPTMPLHDGPVSYGPLHEVEFNPDVVLLFCNPHQAMLIADAARNYKVRSKPTCAGIPEAIKGGTVVISLGCTASRLRAGYGQNELVVVIPGAILDELVERLYAVSVADEKVSKAIREGKA